MIFLIPHNYNNSIAKHPQNKPETHHVSPLLLHFPSSPPPLPRHNPTMLRSAVVLRLRLSPSLHHLLPSHFSTTPQPQPSPPPQTPDPSLAGAPPKPRREAKRGTYEDEQARVLRAALGHVAKLGWSESALVAGARDVGVSPALVGSIERKDAALVEFFMDDCLQILIDKVDDGLGLEELIPSGRLSKLIRIRLEMQVPYVSKWAEALSIQAQPTNLPTSFKQRAMLVDEFWHVAGDQGSDIDWYVKRTILGGIYSTSEVYMLTDKSPEFRDTWTFVDGRVKDAFDLQKSVQEAAYLAETVGAGVGTSVQNFVNKLCHR